MRRSTNWKIAVSTLAVVLGMGFMVIEAILIGCTPLPFLVNGPGLFDNRPPTLDIISPTQDLTRGQGDAFIIRWTDSDSDDVANVSFSLVNAENFVITLVTGIKEDPTSIGIFTAQTILIPPGSYNILGTIDDGVNVPVNKFAETADSAAPRRVVVTIVGEGEGPQTEPPIITVTEPRFNLSVSQDDILTVVVQPSEFFDPDIPFDPDSDLNIFVLLDFDSDPTNDDPSDPVDSQIILLDQRIITAGSFDPITFLIPIDLDKVKPRPNGEPYFIRITADDGTNPRVHQYAVGTINVVRLAAGLVDLFDIGTTKAGVTFIGFNPGANVGSTITTVEDFDDDGVADFIIAAQFGNPRNVGPVGEAYLVYGQDQVRFGGKIGVNSISETVSGVIFEAPPVRSRRIQSPNPRSDGITDISFVRDLTGDGRPEILMGLAHVHGAFEAMDFDPSDEDLANADDSVNIEVVIRQAEIIITIGQDNPITTTFFNGVEEVSISSSEPNANKGTDSFVSWQNNGPNQSEWALIKFKDILDELPDDVREIDVESVRATLEVRIFDTGGDATVHRLLTNFNEQTTFNTFSITGGAPDPGVDYEVAAGSGGGIGTITGGGAETTTVDISDEIKLLMDGVLQGDDNELRFIMVPVADGINKTSIRSSEFSIKLNRPTIRITYPRLNVLGALGCFPDDLVNNRTDTDQQDPVDVQFTGGGMMIFFNSENRDNDPRIVPTPARLDTTSIALELVGQESGPLGRWILGGDDVNQEGNIFARADDHDEELRLAGARFMAGPFDFEDHRFLNQVPREDLFGQNVASIGDLNNDGMDEIIISSPLNERHIEDLFTTFGFQSTHWWSTRFRGSITVIPGHNYNNVDPWREISSDVNGSTSIPTLDQQTHGPNFGRCLNPAGPRHLDVPIDTFEVFAEDIDDMLGGAQSAGDFNQDGLDDILCGAYLNDKLGAVDSGAVYILYGRNILGDFDLKRADDVILRAPMLRIQGIHNGDQIGWKQTTGLDVNGDRIDDVFISSPRTDYGGITRDSCTADFNSDGSVNTSDLLAFNNCILSFGDHVFSDDDCKIFDYDNDEDIDTDDRCVFCCISGDCSVDDSCVAGKNPNACCENIVDNGFIGVVFGGTTTTGDRSISKIGTPDLPGAIFFGGKAGHRAGMDVSSAGDFNQDGFGDLLITVPGETRCDREIPSGSECADVGRERLGVVYLIFGGLHLFEDMPVGGWNLSDPDKGVGSASLPGIVFVSPFVIGRPNEAAPTVAAFLGDINNDGFGDIAIGNPQADFIDLSFPQGPNAPGSDAAVGRRRNAGHVYIVYGNNFGSNRDSPP